MGTEPCQVACNCLLAQMCCSSPLNPILTLTSKIIPAPGPFPGLPLLQRPALAWQCLWVWEYGILG